jgi:hypothetical protein
MKSIEEFSAPGIVVLTKEQKEQMIADVMDDFDFDKVHDVMKALGWEWIARTGDGEVPGVWSIAKRAKKLLDEVMEYYGDEEHHAISTGGFTAMLEEDGTLSLLFVIEQTLACPYYYQVNNEEND